MMEYLDERFPHPPLLPVYPVARAQSRLLIYRIERDSVAAGRPILGGEEKETTLNKLRGSCVTAWSAWRRSSKRRPSS